jgi:hypothetical protein
MEGFTPVRKSTAIVAFAASAALVAASAGASFGSAPSAKSNSGSHVTMKQSHYTPAKATPMSKRFKAVDQPKGKYVSKSCDIDLSSIPDFTTLSSVTGCGTTVTLSSVWSKQSVPNGGWASWGSPPDTESATPNVLWSSGQSVATVDFGKTVKWGGFEVEPDQFAVETTTVDFYAGANGTGKLRGSVTRDPNGQSGALLFGGHAKKGFKSAVITNSVGDDFSIAQIRV